MSVKKKKIVVSQSITKYNNFFTTC